MHPACTARSQTPWNCPASRMKGNPIELTDEELGEIAVPALWSD
jgi:hypothetical protein